MRTFVSLFAVASLLLVACPGKKAVTAHSGETWLATYLNDQKVGYSVTRYSRTESGFRFESFLKLEVAMSGTPQTVQSKSEVETGTDLVLQTMKFSMKAGDREVSITGIVQGNELEVRAAGDKSRKVQLKGPVYPMAAIGQLVMARKPWPESTFQVTVFDATVLAVVPVEVHILGRDKLQFGGQDHEALKIRTKMSKLEMLSWLDDDGMVVAEQSPPNVRSQRVTAAEALAEETGQGKLDILKMFRVVVDTLIPDPAGVRQVKLEIGSISGGKPDLEIENQQPKGDDAVVVEVKVPDVPQSAPLPVTGQDEYLAATVSVQCDDPAIKAKMVEAIGQPKDAVEAARKLVSWVFSVVEKEPTASFPTALDVLRHMKGDCNEHAVFLAALARAAGVPTKIAAGLVYLDGAFYYHAWNEVFLGQWIPVDATFGEFPASALHLKLAEGELDQQTQILSVVGNLKIRILEYRK